jgi:hypothetical protein
VDDLTTRGYALANAGHDTRAIQAWMGHKNIQHTARYTELSPTRFKDFLIAVDRKPQSRHCLLSSLRRAAVEADADDGTQRTAAIFPRFRSSNRRRRKSRAEAVKYSGAGI